MAGYPRVALKRAAAKALAWPVQTALDAQLSTVLCTGACHNRQICATARQAIDHSLHCWTHRAACCCCCYSSGWHETRHRAEIVPVQMPKIKYKLLPRRRRCATQRCVCKIVERIKKSRMHATTMDNVAQGENQCNSRQQSRFSDDVLANANVDAIILPAHSPVAIVLLLQGSNTYIGPGSHRQKATSSLSLSLSFSSLPFPCSVVAKCNHCNRFCTISNVHSALKTLLLWLSARFLGVAAA